MWILDASIGVKWFFSDESHHDLAKTVLDKLIFKPDGFAVPDLFLTEFAAVMVKKSKEDILFCKKALEVVSSIGIYTVATPGKILESAIQFACDHPMSVYDSIYIATAKFLGGKWLSSDEVAVRRAGPQLALSLSSWHEKLGR